MVVAWISFRAQPHKRPEILSAVDEMVERMRNSAGCGRGRLFADSEDPNAFTVISEWQSADDADAFFNSRDFQVFRGIRMLLRGEPFIVFDEVRARVTRLFR
jgi:quinol monooxygenase YgiN